MKKICFDKKNKIIGFDLEDSRYYINVFYINNIYKNIQKSIKINDVDDLGRKKYRIENNKKIPLLIDKEVKSKCFLEIEPNEFNVNDIIDIKKNQLIKKYNCSDCLLEELLGDDVFNFKGATCGKNILKILSNNEIISNKISTEYEKFYIYYEADNELTIEYSYNGINYHKFYFNEVLKSTNSGFTIKISSKKETNIYSFAILLQ